MGISHLRDRAPHRLSGGEKKRVALASVLITDPEVILLDEPSAALDPLSQAQIVDLLVSWKGSGKTVITATHDLDNLGGYRRPLLRLRRRAGSPGKVRRSQCCMTSRCWSAPV